MPELTWIGKEAVMGHHAQVPFGLLEKVPELSCPPAEGGTENLIVQGGGICCSTGFSGAGARLAAMC